MTPELVRAEPPDAVIRATGARPRVLTILGAEDAHVVTAWQVLREEANVSGSVVIADWRCDWIGLGIAEMLARDGRHVRLCVNGYILDEANGSIGVGIPGMRMRVQQFNGLAGTLELDSNGSGTTLRASVPLARCALSADRLRTATAAE